MAARGETIRTVFREEPKDVLPDGRMFWYQVTALQALSIAAEGGDAGCHIAPTRSLNLWRWVGCGCCALRHTIVKARVGLICLSPMEGNLSELGG
jgi:hypothetical protein